MIQPKIAWDWIGIQMEGSREELMLYAIHRFEEDIVSFGGTYYDDNQKVIYLSGTDLFFEAVDFWESPSSKIKYPIAWDVVIPRLGYEFEIRAVLPHQELDMHLGPARLSYWEGKCQVKGKKNGEEIEGRAYVELTNRKRMNKALDR